MNRTDYCIDRLVISSNWYLNKQIEWDQMPEYDKNRNVFCQELLPLEKNSKPESFIEKRNWLKSTEGVKIDISIGFWTIAKSSLTNDSKFSMRYLNTVQYNPWLLHCALYIIDTLYVVAFERFITDEQWSFFEFHCEHSKIHVHARFMLISHSRRARLHTDFYPSA